MSESVRPVRVLNYEQRMLSIVPHRFRHSRAERCPTCGFDVYVIPGEVEWRPVNDRDVYPVRCPGHRPSCLFSAGQPAPAERMR